MQPNFRSVPSDGPPSEGPPEMLSLGLGFCGRQLGAHHVAERSGRRRLGGLFVLVDLAALDLLDRGAIAEADAARLRADFDDFEVVLFARLKRAGALERAGSGTKRRGAIVAALALFDFGVVAKRFDVFADVHKRAESGDARYFAFHHVPNFVRLEPIAKNVVDLLHAQRHTAIFRVDLEHLGGDVFALLEDLVRILDALRPADVANVDEAIEAIFKLNERAKLGDVAHFSGDHHAHGIFFRGEQPGIRLGLLDAEGNAAVAGFDVQHDYIDFVSDFHDLRRMLYFFRPAEFGDVHQAFDTLLELDKYAVVHYAYDFAFYLAAGGIFFRSADPRVRHQLFEAERNALLFLVKFQDDDVEFLIRLDHVGRMLDAAPAEVGEVQQPVDAADVHERAVFGDVLNVAVDLLAFVQRLQQFAALGLQLFFEQRATADHDVAAAA